MSEPTPRLQRLAIVAPSDRITPEEVSQRDVSSHADYDGLMRRRPQDERIPQAFYLAMKTKEDRLIEKAFASAIGAEDPFPQSSRQELVEALVEDYRVFQLADGVHTAEELIRDVEASARKQGLAQRPGKGRA